MDLHQDLEERAKEVGSEIYSLIGGQVPSLFDQKRWKGRRHGVGNEGRSLQGPTLQVCGRSTLPENR